MKIIKALLLVLLSASSLVVATTVALASEQWAMVMMGLFLVAIQLTRTSRAAEPLVLDDHEVHKV